MSSDDLLHHMACDFAQWIGTLVPGWDKELQPADSFIDTVYCAFGDQPTRESVINAFKSGNAVRAVRDQMTKLWETDLITEDAARALVERAIINNFGRDAVA